MNLTTNELISVKDVGSKLGKRKQTIFKIIKRLGIDVQKRRDSASKNQFVAYIAETVCIPVNSGRHSVSFQAPIPI